jgi:hypothetical protein
MCSQCEGLSPILKLNFVYEYLSLLEQLRAMVDRRSLKLTDATCELEKVRPDGVWSDDLIEHVFECTQCGQHFRLVFETYHSLTGTWEPTEFTKSWLSRYLG